MMIRSDDTDVKNCLAEDIHWDQLARIYKRIAETVVKGCPVCHPEGNSQCIFHLSLAPQEMGAALRLLRWAVGISSCEKIGLTQAAQASIAALPWSLWRSGATAIFSQCRTDYSLHLSNEMRLVLAMRRLGKAGCRPAHFLWSQPEDLLALWTEGLRHLVWGPWSWWHFPDSSKSLLSVQEE